MERNVEKPLKYCKNIFTLMKWFVFHQSVMEPLFCHVYKSDMM